MPCPHNEITIVQRSQRQSAVAAAAYQSGEKLFCEYDQQVKHYPEKRGIVHNEILLPANAPQEYADRNTLWNAAEAVENQWNSQLARRWVLMPSTARRRRKCGSPWRSRATLTICWASRTASAKRNRSDSER